MKVAKQRTTIDFNVDTLKKIEAIQITENISSRNKVIEKAIDFYYGFLSSAKSQEFLLSAYGQTMEGMLDNLESHLAKILYKSAVETNVLTRVVASALEVDRTQYDKMRKAALDDTRFSNGTIKISEV